MLHAAPSSVVVHKTVLTSIPLNRDSAAATMHLVVKWLAYLAMNLQT